MHAYAHAKMRTQLCTSKNMIYMGMGEYNFLNAYPILLHKTYDFSTLVAVEISRIYYDTFPRRNPKHISVFRKRIKGEFFHFHATKIRLIRSTSKSFAFLK